MKKIALCKKGATSIEYAIIASLVSIFIITGLVIVGEETKAKYDCIGENIQGNYVDCENYSPASGNSGNTGNPGLAGP